MKFKEMQEEMDEWKDQLVSEDLLLVPHASRSNLGIGGSVSKMIN